MVTVVCLQEEAYGPHVACALDNPRIGQNRQAEDDLGRCRSRLRVRERDRELLRRSLRGGVGSLARWPRSGDLTRLRNPLAASSRSRRSAMAFSLAESLSLCVGAASASLPKGSLCGAARSEACLALPLALSLTVEGLGDAALLRGALAAPCPSWLARSFVFSALSLSLSA